MKVKYKKKSCEVIQEYGDVFVIKYNGKSVQALKKDIKLPATRKKKDNDRDKTKRDAMENRPA